MARSIPYAIVTVTCPTPPACHHIQTSKYADGVARMGHRGGGRVVRPKFSMQLHIMTMNDIHQPSYTHATGYPPPPPLKGGPATPLVSTWSSSLSSSISSMVYFPALGTNFSRFFHWLLVLELNFLQNSFSASSSPLNGPRYFWSPRSPCRVARHPKPDPRK